MMWIISLIESSDRAQSDTPSAFEDAVAAKRCVMLDADTSASIKEASECGFLIEVKDALGQHVSVAVPAGGSKAQLDMWQLMIKKVCVAV